MTKKKKEIILKALKAAFPHTVPILAGFLFLGITWLFDAAILKQWAIPSLPFQLQN